MIRAHTCLYACTNFIARLDDIALAKAIVLESLLSLLVPFIVGRESKRTTFAFGCPFARRPHHFDLHIPTIMESTCVRALPFWLKPFGV